MRDFQMTAEPRGDGQSVSHPAKTLPFVVQKHAATRLHYDFRLGWSGVFKSWAIAKGPSYFPGDKRLAVQVEDHPVEYGGFEGTIPQGQYGGGTVMVWDFGVWEPLGDVDRGLKEGRLEFDLHGKKLRGKWALVRMHALAGRSDKPNWLLIKEKDGFARDDSEPAIVDKSPDSAITRRSIDEIATSEDHVWDFSSRNDQKRSALHENRRQVSTEIRTERNGSTRTRAIQPTNSMEESAIKRGVKRGDNRSAIVAFCPREKMPAFVPPQLAQQATEPPKDTDWIHELKLDGYRIQIHVRANKSRSRGKTRRSMLLTRKGLDWSARMPNIARAAAELPVESAIFDGEVVALDEKGQSNFADLQIAFQEGKQGALSYFAFDLLHLDGRNLRNLPLSKRKRLLSDIFAQSEEPLRLSEHLQVGGDDVFVKACSLGAEGIVSKFAPSRYQSGRSSTWIKAKCIQEQEFVIGGFTVPSKGGKGIGALLLGYYENGNLSYAGRSGTGFTRQTHRALRKRLDGLAEPKPAFVSPPADARRDARWVRPELVARVAFATWTRDHLVRQASFKGLREDKPAQEVIREVPIVANKIFKRTGTASNNAGKHEHERERAAMMDLFITHPDKVLDPESRMTKEDLARYYIAVAEHMLPHVADRPLSVVRCPDGSSKPCFFQKHVGTAVPMGVSSVPIANRKTGEKEEFLTVNSAEGLVGLAQMGVLEIHTWGSNNNSPNVPDRIVFDLDPGDGIDWQTLAAAALELRALLKRMKLEGFLKSTGGKGLHVVVPIEADSDWSTVKQFAHTVVLRMEKSRPDLYLTKMAKAARKNRIYLDYLRNDHEATSIAPYSSRARSGVPVAMPLDWKELESHTRPAFHVMDLTVWIKRLRRDPWKAMAKVRQSLTVDILRFLGTKSRSLK
jgi:bifunctional non-homologous end joining protein LigD